MDASEHQRSKVQIAGLVLGPVLFFIFLLFDLVPGEPIVTRMAQLPF